MIDSIILTVYPLCVRRRRVPWVTGPNDVIKPLPIPWLGLRGDGFLGCYSLGMTNGFLEEWSSFLSVFLLGALFPTALDADEDAFSFPFSFFSSSLRTIVDTLTKALCLVASISVKDRGREDKHKDNKEGTKRNKERKTYDDKSICSIYEL